MMKKITSKLIACLLALVMVLGCASTAFAAGGPTEITGTTGTITVQKYDSSDASGEGDQISGTAVKGATFSAYRILDYNTGTGEYTVNENFTGSIEVKDVVGSSTGTSYGSTDELEAKISELQNKIKTDKISAVASGTTNKDGRATLDKSDGSSALELGVYLIWETEVPAGYTISSQAFLVSLPQWDQEKNQWNYDITAYPKDKKITVTKTMGDNDATKDSYSIGDKIPYTVTAMIPEYGNVPGSNPAKPITTALLEEGAELEKNNDADPYKKYNDLKVVFTDTLSKGLTLNMDDVEDLTVKILDGKTENEELKNGAVNNSDAVLKAVTGYTEDKAVTNEGKDFLVTTKTDEKTGITTMTVTVSWSVLEQYQGKNIQLTYSATLNEDAVPKDENKNTVDYEFTNDPQQYFGDGRTHTDPDPETTAYTYQMDLTKLLNGAEPGNVDVSGVTFQLYAEDDETPLYVQKLEDGSYAIRTDLKTASESGEITQDIHPTEIGELHVKGFKAGTYKLVETASIKGYTLLKKPVMIVVEENTEDGSDTVLDGKVKAYTLKADGKTLDEWLTKETGNENGIFAITVNNLDKQFNLPVTGGSGLWMFTIGGGILMAAAIIFFYTMRMRRRKGI